MRWDRCTSKQISVPRVAEASTWKSTAAITRNKLGKVVNEQIRLVAFDLICGLEELKEAARVTSLIKDDGDGADEELYCVPRANGTQCFFTYKIGSKKNRNLYADYQEYRNNKCKPP